MNTSGQQTQDNLVGIRDTYQQLMLSFCEAGDEHALMAFNELGAKMLRAGLPPETAVETHAIAAQRLKDKLSDEVLADTNSLVPLLELIMAYGVAFRQQVDAQQQKATERFYHVLDQSKDLVYVIDHAGNLNYTNTAFEQDAESHGKHSMAAPRFVEHSDFISPEVMWTRLRAGKSFKGRVASEDAADQFRFYSVNAFCLTESELITHFVFMLEDIGTQLLVEQRQRQSERLASLGELASGIAHEFNNILLVILGFAELIQEEDEPEIIEDFSGEIVKAVQKGRALNQQILSFAREDALPVQAESLSTLVANCKKLLTVAVGQRVQLTMSCDIEVNVVLSEAHLAQILTNLCINACHAIESHATPVRGSIDITFDQEAEDLTISVSDNGVGMDQETQAAIFEPFYTTKDVGKGSGLGLSIVQKLVSQYEGWIEVESEINVGTRFKIALPVLVKAIVMEAAK